MTTVGRGILQKPAFDLFDAMRSYDAKKAAAQLADDAVWRSPWSGGEVSGKAAIEAHLQAWLGDPKARPSLTIADIAGDGTVIRLTLSVSGRFGQAPQLVQMAMVVVKGQIHQVIISPLGGAAAH
jgi:ketosteroid isomerase-like protein